MWYNTTICISLILVFIEHIQLFAIFNWYGIRDAVQLESKKRDSFQLLKGSIGSKFSTKMV